MEEVHIRLVIPWSHYVPTAMEMVRLIVTRAGVALSLLSGFLFTSNNFVINQSQVCVSDLVLVRTVLQVLVYTVITRLRGERILATSPRQQLYTVTQGTQTEQTHKYFHT